jgi:hypothetical protein
MGYEGWTAVCPRCGAQNGSNHNACSNCHRGPILCERVTSPYGTFKYRNYQCQVCRVVYNNTRCRQCGTDIGQITNRTPLRRFLTFAIVAIVIYFLWHAYHSRHDSTSNAEDAAQIKQVVQTWTDAFNGRNVATMGSLLCGGVQLPPNPFNPRDIRGNISAEVTNLRVDGNQAYSSIMATFGGGLGHETLGSTYAKENGSWKICRAIIY